MYGHDEPCNHVFAWNMLHRPIIPIQWSYMKIFFFNEATKFCRIFWPFMLTSVDDLHVCLEVVECPNNLQPKKVIIPMMAISALTQQIQFQHEEKPPDPFGPSLTLSPKFSLYLSLFLPPLSHSISHTHTPSTNKVGIATLNLVKEHSTSPCSWKSHTCSINPTLAQCLVTHTHRFQLHSYIYTYRDGHLPKNLLGDGGLKLLVYSVGYLVHAGVQELHAYPYISLEGWWSYIRWEEDIILVESLSMYLCMYWEVKKKKIENWVHWELRGVPLYTVRNTPHYKFNV